MIPVNSTHPFHNFLGCDSLTGSRKQIREQIVPVSLFRNFPQEIVTVFRLLGILRNLIFRYCSQCASREACALSGVEGFVFSAQRGLCFFVQRGFGSKTIVVGKYITTEEACFRLRPECRGQCRRRRGDRRRSCARLAVRRGIGVIRQSVGQTSGMPTPPKLSLLRFYSDARLFLFFRVIFSSTTL